MQWNWLRALEALDEQRARDCLEACGGLSPSAAGGPLEPLRPWPGLSDEHYAAYQRVEEQARLRRLIDYVLPGDRVLDVGCGFGYVSGVLLRDAPLACYFGIDVGAHRVHAAREMLKTNGLTDRPAHFEVRDLHALDDDLLRACRPTLVLVCEVLEHLREPLQALRALWRHAPEDADLLFTVPMAGRLESVRGHVSFFNVDRLRYLLRAAKLDAWHVEPLANRWVFVLCSRAKTTLHRVAWVAQRSRGAPAPEDAAASAFSQPVGSSGAPHCRQPATAPSKAVTSRAGRARAETSDPPIAPTATFTPPPADAPPGLSQTGFAIRGHLTDLTGPRFSPVRFSARVDAHRSHWDYRARRVELSRAEDGLKCWVEGGPDSSAGQYGGICFPADSPAAIRLDLTVLAPENIVSVHVAGYDTRGMEPAVQWVWKRRPQAPVSGRRQTHVLVPGRPGAFFVPYGAVQACPVRQIHLFVRIDPGSRAGFVLHRAELAFHLPAESAPVDPSARSRA